MHRAVATTKTILLVGLWRETLGFTQHDGTKLHFGLERTLTRNYRTHTTSNVGTLLHSLNQEDKPCSCNKFLCGWNEVDWEPCQFDNTIHNKCIGKSSVYAFLACARQALISLAQIDTDAERLEIWKIETRSKVQCPGLPRAENLPECPGGCKHSRPVFLKRRAAARYRAARGSRF